MTVGLGRSDLRLLRQVVEMANKTNHKVKREFVREGGQNLCTTNKKKRTLMMMKLLLENSKF